MSRIVDGKLLVKGRNNCLWVVHDEKHLNNYLLEWKEIDNLEYVEALKLLKLKEKQKCLTWTQ